MIARRCTYLASHQTRQHPSRGCSDRSHRASAVDTLEARRVRETQQYLLGRFCFLTSASSRGCGSLLTPSANARRRLVLCIVVALVRAVAPVQMLSVPSFVDAPSRALADPLSTPKDIPIGRESTYGTTAPQLEEQYTLLKVSDHDPSCHVHGSTSSHRHACHRGASRTWFSPAWNSSSQRASPYHFLPYFNARPCPSL